MPKTSATDYLICAVGLSCGYTFHLVTRGFCRGFIGHFVQEFVIASEATYWLLIGHFEKASELLAQADSLSGSAGCFFSTRCTVAVEIRWSFAICWRL